MFAFSNDVNLPIETTTPDIEVLFPRDAQKSLNHGSHLEPAIFTPFFELPWTIQNASQSSLRARRPYPRARPPRHLPPYYYGEKSNCCKNRKIAPYIHTERYIYEYRTRPLPSLEKERFPLQSPGRHNRSRHPHKWRCSAF